MTKKQLVAEGTQLFNTVPQMVLEYGIKPSYIAVKKAFVNGEDVCSFKCTCGHEWQERSSTGRVYIGSGTTCPMCHKYKTTMFGSECRTLRKVGQTLESDFYAETTDTGFWAANFSGYTKNMSDPFTWMDAPEWTIKVNYVVAFDESYGYVVLEDVGSDNIKVLKKGTVREMGLIKRLRYDESGISLNGVDFKSLALDADKVEREMKEKRMEKLSGRKSAKLKKELGEQQYVPKIKIDGLGISPGTTLWTLRDDYRDETGKYVKRAYVFCWHCQKVSLVDDSDDAREQGIQCPSCGSQLERSFGGYRGYSKRQLYVVETADIEGNSLLLRKICATWTLTTSGKVERTLEEYERIFISRNGCTAFSVHKNEVSKVKFTDVDGCCNVDSWAQSLEERRAKVENSCMTKTGLDEAIKETPSFFFSYLRAWFKMPQIEFLIKGNLPNVLNDLLNNPGVLPERCQAGKTLSEFLNVQNATIKVSRRLKLSWLNTLDADWLLKTEPSLEDNAIRRLVNPAIINQIRALPRYGIKPSRAIEYLDNVYNHQCIEEREALTIWTDYLRMASKIGIDLSDKSRKFPSSLKKEHDIAMFAYNKIKQEITDKEFEKQAEENAKQLEYSKGDYFVCVPRTVEDVVREATNQKNCLRSYVTRIANGETSVCFIRKKKAPDESYVTVEVYNSRINQLKGFANSNPRDKELMEFVKSWQAAKNIRWA